MGKQTGAGKRRSGKRTASPPAKPAPKDNLHKTRLGPSKPKLMKPLESIINIKDLPTSRHCESVARYSLSIGKELNLPGDQLDKLNQAALLHDIGKLMVDNCVLNKSKPLNESENLQIRSHPGNGMRILTLFHMNEYIIDAAWHHHERWDGGGYPDGKTGESISLLTRIVSIADALDAMAEDRPYRKHLNDDEIITQIQMGRGSQFDPELADIAVKLIKERRLGKSTGQGA